MSKTLLTGVSGNVGKQAMNYLIEKEKTFSAGVRNIDKYKKREEYSNVDLVELDFEDKESYDQALEGIDKVFLVRPPELTDIENIFKPFINKCKEKYIRHIVFLSLLGAEKNRLTPHSKIEKLIKESNIPYTFIRPSFFMQNLSNVHRDDIKDKNRIFIPVGNAKISFIDTRDIGEIVGITLTEKGHRKRAYTITGPEAINCYDLAERMSGILGRDIRYLKPKILKFRKEMIHRGIKKEFATVMSVIYLTTKLGMANKVTNTAEVLLKRPPKTVDEFIRDYKDCWI